MHNNEKFTFLDKDGNLKEFETVPYSFDLEDNVLVNRFGKDTLEEFARTHVLNFKIHLADIQEDFPRLLVGDLSIIDFRKQEGKYYDEMRRVYYFFLEFDSNATSTPMSITIMQPLDIVLNPKLFIKRHTVSGETGTAYTLMKYKTQNHEDN